MADDIVDVAATPAESYQPLRAERRSRDGFVKMVEDTERWYERFDWAKPGNGPGRSLDVDLAAFLAMLLPTPNHGHDRAEAAATVTALCRFAAENGLRWRPLLAAIYGVTDRTVDTWVAEAHEAGMEPLTRCREHDDSPPEANRRAVPTITLVFTPSATSSTNKAGEPTRDIEIIGTWSDGRPAETFAPLRAATLRDTVDEQVRLTKDLEERYPGVRARARLDRPSALS